MTEQRSTTTTWSRRAAGSSGAVITGKAVVFGVPSNDMGFIETWNPGAFDAQAAAPRGFDDVVAQVEHTFPTIGRVRAGTLRLTLRPDALYYQIDVPENLPWIAESVGRGDIRGASFSFNNTTAIWGLDSNDYPTRTITAATLIEVSPVTWPCFEQTTATLRTAAARAQVVRLAEKRVGRKLSAASVAKIEAAMATLRDLLDDGDGTDDETLLDLALETDSIKVALEADSGRGRRHMSIDEIDSWMAARTAGDVAERMLEYDLRRLEYAGIEGRL